MNNLTIIMYHYVRPIMQSKYPNIKGLEFADFSFQLDFLSENYKFVTAEEVIYSIKNQKKLSENSCWLTFDDGYKDHYDYVFPELKKRGIQGSFFPPAHAIKNNEMLDVNCIHFILACQNDIKSLNEDLENECYDRGISKKQFINLKKNFYISSRFDSADVRFFKNMLQHALPASVRKNVINKLFLKHVKQSPQEFSKKLYMTKDELNELIESNMFIGSHGSMHYWLDKLNKKNQELDIDESLEFLEDIGVKLSDWIMCYPYGGYNKNTLDLLNKKNCSVGLTVKPEIANLTQHNNLELPRFDTNDFPQKPL